MTTIVAVKKDGQAVMAADSQSTFGEMAVGARFDRSWDKIFEFQGSYFAIAGCAAHDLVLRSAFRGASGLDFSSRDAIFESFRQLHPQLKKKFFLKPEEAEEDPYESNHMSILVMNAHGIFGVYSLREVYEFEQFWAMGSGQPYALGALYASFNNVNAPKHTALDIAQMAVEAGCSFDMNSSLPMSHYTITC